jgi:hypothetical protein
VPSLTRAAPASRVRPITSKNRCVRVTAREGTHDTAVRNISNHVNRSPRIPPIATPVDLAARTHMSGSRSDGRISVLPRTATVVPTGCAHPSLPIRTSAVSPELRRGAAGGQIGSTADHLMSHLCAIIDRRRAHHQTWKGYRFTGRPARGERSTALPIRAAAGHGDAPVEVGLAHTVGSVVAHEAWKTGRRRSGTRLPCRLGPGGFGGAAGSPRSRR